MNEVEIIVTGKNLAKAAFASANADTDVLKRRTEDLALALRRSELAAGAAGNAAAKAMTTAAAAADQAAVSAKAAADAQGKLARSEISAEEAAKADALAQKEAAKATDTAARAALAAERANIALATSAKRAGEQQAAAAAMTSRSSAAMTAGMEKLRSVGKAALQGVVVGAIAIGYESVKSAMKFDQAMTLINTQAGVSKSKIAGLSQGVLKLAGDVAQNPDSLAEALFHVESNFASMGITSKRALDITRVAAEGAKVGNANLVDVTNALTAAVASGIPGVQNMDKAMGVLNATVGAGDMKMQDLADAMGSGMVAVVKGYGLSITDVGAALATFGDNNIRGANAGTMLRMSVQALAVPAAHGAAALKALGLQSDSLAKDMQKGGLKLAMTDLIDRMHKTGVGAKQQGALITEIFGKKAGAGVAVLAGQFDRLMSKYPDLEKGANGFSGAWATTQKTFAFQMTQIEDRIKALGIAIGEKLIPVISKMIGWFNQHTTVLKVAAAVIGGILLVAIGAYTVSMIGAAAATVAATWPILAVVAAVGLLVAGVIYAWTHFKGFRDVMLKVWEDIKVAWELAKKHWQVLVIAIMGPLGALVVYMTQHTAQMKKVWAQVWKELQKDWKSFQHGPLKDIQNALKEVQKWWKENGAEIVKWVKFYWQAISLEISIVLTLIKGTLTVAFSIIKSIFTTVWGIIRDLTKTVWAGISGTVTGAMHLVRNIITLVLDVIHGKWGKVWGDLKRLAGQALHDVVKTITGVASGFGNLLYNAGKNVIQGLINGISSMAGAVGNTVSSIASKIIGFFPHSPAKEGPLSGAGSPDKSGATIVDMLSTGMTARTSAVASAATAVSGAAVSGLTSAARHRRPYHRHPRHHKPPRQNIDQQLGHIAHNEGHMSTHAVDVAIEKIMAAHRLTVAQLGKATQILLAKGGHPTSAHKIDSLVAEMKKHYKGLTSVEILKAAISELEKHPRLSTTQLMGKVAKDLHATPRTTKKKAGSGGSGASSGYLSDLSWRAGGVQYTVGGAGRSTGPGGSAAGATGGSTGVGSGQQLTIVFGTLHVEVDLKGGSGSAEDRELIERIRKGVRIRGGNVQKVLGH